MSRCSSYVLILDKHVIGVPRTEKRVPLLSAKISPIKAAAFIPARRLLLWEVRHAFVRCRGAGEWESGKTLFGPVLSWPKCVDIADLFLLR